MFGVARHARGVLLVAFVPAVKLLKPAADVLATQEQISRQISEKLRLQLSGAEMERMNRHTTEDSEAYQSYLQQVFTLTRRTSL